ncbi:unnamed protein product [Rhizophagus irregularis]|uniref:Uncharacterized protein n=1 Tax=Rhizophagus irregularis TaxID=588596 RepID=A0A2I1H7I7_9GLOM|nr:hypothetical protein RhiirA4_473865 [Rhizophagus irregularis]CAB4446523.1 unnamed protein product [Rhizophagus irregularis]
MDSQYKRYFKKKSKYWHLNNVLQDQTSSKRKLRVAHSEEGIMYLLQLNLHLAGNHILDWLILSKGIFSWPLQLALDEEGFFWPCL